MRTMFKRFSSLAKFEITIGEIKMYKSLFLDAQNDDKKIILDYFNLLNGYILKKTDPHYPYIQGKFPKQLNSFLNEKELNFDKQSPEDVLFEMAEYFRGTTRWHHPFV